MAIYSFDDDETEDKVQNNPPQVPETTVTDEVPDYVIEQAMDVPWEVPPALSEYDSDNHSSSEVIGAHFRESNTAYLTKQAYDIGRLGNGELDPDFNLDESLKNEGITDTFGYFSDVKNQDQFNQALKYHYDHIEDMKILSDTPFARRLTLGLVAGIADPINYIPVARAIKWGTTAVRAGIEGAILGGIGSGIAYKVHKDISPQEVAIDVVASGLCSAMLAHVTKEETRQALKAGFKDVLTGKVEVKPNSDLVYELMGLKSTAQQKARNFFIYPTPQLQAQNSEDPLIKSLSPYISYDRQFTTTGNEYSVQEGINAFNVKFNKWYNTITKNKQEYIKKQKEAGISPELAQEEWEREAKRAIVTWLDNPIGETPDHSDITGLLKIGKDCLAEAKKYDVLSEDFANFGITTKSDFVLTRDMSNLSDEAFNNFVSNIYTGNLSDNNLKRTTANNYFPRIYNFKKLKENSEYYHFLLERSIKLNNPKMPTKEIKSLAYQMLADMTGEGVNGRTSNIRKSSDISFAQRTVAISDELLFDALDLDSCINSYYRSLKRITAATQLNRVAKGAGFDSWSSLEKKYADQLNTNSGRKIVEGDISPGEMVNAKNNHKLLTDIRLLYMGDFTKTDTFANNRLLKALNETTYLQYAWQLGSTLIRSLNDLAIDVFHFGFLRTGKNLATILAKDRQARRDVLFNMSFLERMKDSSIRFFLDSEEETLSSFKRATKKIADWENKVSLQHYWDKALRKTALEELYSDTIKVAYKVGDNIDITKLDKREKNFFEAIGLTEDSVKEIRSAFDKYGENYLGIAYVDPVHLSAQTSEHLSTVLRTLTDQIVLTPSATNVPIWTRSELGRMIHHYVNYGFMAYENVFLPMVRGKYGISRMAQGIAASLALTALSEWLYNYSNDKETDWLSGDTWKNIVTGSHLLNPIIWAADKGSDVLGKGTYAVAERFVPAAAWLANTTSAVRNLVTGDVDRIRWNKFPGFNLWEAKILKRLSEDL